VFELPAPQPERDSDETSRGFKRAGGRTSRQFDFDGSIVKRRAAHKGLSFAIGNLSIFDDLDGALTEIVRPSGCEFLLTS
jgi:hypothetical protein